MKTKKKVLHIISGLTDGGAEAVLYRLIRSEIHFDHFVISLMDSGKYGKKIYDCSVPVECLMMPRGRITFAGVAKAIQIITKINPDVIQTWMYHADFIGGILGRLCGVKVICWGIHNSSLASSKTKLLTRFLIRVNSLLSRFIPNHIICCADEAKKIHLQLGYSSQKMAVITNGYDLQEFRPSRQSRSNIRFEWGLAENLFVIGMVARFDPQKDHANLIAALKLLSGTLGVQQQWVCVLVGNLIDKSNNKIMKWINEANLLENVILLGQSDDMPVLFNGFDLNVLSSAYGEAFPNVLAEAMASGTPCVSTRVGDAEVIIGKTGWIINPARPAELAAAMYQAFCEWHDKEAWQNRCQAARDRINQNFSIQKMAKLYGDVWYSAMR